MTNRYRNPQSPDFRLDYYVENNYVSKLTATDEEIVSTIKSPNLRKQIRKDVKDILNELVDLARTYSIRTDLMPPLLSLSCRWKSIIPNKIFSTCRMHL